MAGPIPIENSFTLILNNFAVIKWPNSCKAIIIPKNSMANKMGHIFPQICENETDKLNKFKISTPKNQIASSTAFLARRSVEIMSSKVKLSVSFTTPKAVLMRGAISVNLILFSLKRRFASSFAEFTAAG